MYENYCKIRDKMGYKDSDVAKATGITKSTFSDWKSGRSVPKQDKLKKIADYLNVSIEYLIGWNTQPGIDTILLDNLYNFFQNYPLVIYIQGTYFKFYPNDICSITENDDIYYDINIFFQNILDMTLEDFKTILNRTHIPTPKEFANIITFFEISIADLLELPPSPYEIAKISFIHAAFEKAGYICQNIYTINSSEKSLLMLKDLNDFRNVWEIDGTLYNTFMAALDSFLSSHIEQLLSKSKKYFSTTGEYKPHDF